MLILGFEQLSAAPPAVFDDYFEQDVKVAASLDFVAHFVADLTLNDVSGGPPHTEGGDQGLSSRKQMDTTFGKVIHDGDHSKLYYFKNVFFF